MGKNLYCGMATVKFLLKGKKNPSTIYLRFRDGSKIDITLSTNLTINPEFWNPSKGSIRQIASFKEKAIYESRLRDLESLIYKERNDRIESGLLVSKDWLKGVIDRKQGRSVSGSKDYLIYNLERYKKQLPHKMRNGKQGVSAGAIRNYNTTISRLTKFEEHFNTRIRIVDVDLSFHDKYLKYASEKLGLAPNSIGKDIQQIKTVCLDSKDRGERINEQALSRKFNKPSEQTIFTTLNEQELNLLFEYKGKNYLENARDWLIIGCWTGCRVGDLMRLTEKNFALHHSGRRLIQYTQSKTGKQINVPMHQQVESIIERLGGFPRALSSAKFNQYIKEVCRAVGMNYTVEGTRQNPITHKKEVGTFEKWELIKSHTCRRSFATNHYNELPNKKIMSVTGHSTEKMLLNYIGEVEDDHVDDFFELWDSSNEKSNNRILKLKKNT